MTKNPIELPQQIQYYIKQIETSKNRQDRFEYFSKLKDIYTTIGKTIDKYKIEFLEK